MPETPDKLILCPYCGHPQHGGTRCVECGGLFDSLSLKATQVSMGPWFIRDKANPFRPGCAYDVVVRHVRAGKIKPTTVMRGPTTRQFWAVARNVPGVAHLLGYCHNCNHHVQPGDRRCASCGAHFAAVQHRNELGLMFPTEAAVATANKMLEKELVSAGAGGGGGAGGGASTLPGRSPRSSGSAGGSTGPTGAGAAAAAGNSLGANLLRDVLGSDAMFTPSSGGDAASEPPPPQSLPPVKTGFMDMEATASRTGGPRPPQRIPAAASASGAAARALDFGPSDNAEATEEEAQSGGTGRQLSNLQQQNRKLSLMTWLLVAFNVLVLVGVVVLFLYYFRSPPTSTTQTNPSPTWEPTQQTATTPPAVSLFDGPTATGPGQVALNGEGEGADDVDAATTPNGADNTVRVPPSTTATQATSAPPATTPTTDPRRAHREAEIEAANRMVAGLKLAQQMEHAKDFKGALRMLQSLQGMTNDAALNIELAKAMRRVKAEINPAEFYGLPVN